MKLFLNTITVFLIIAALGFSLAASHLSGSVYNIYKWGTITCLLALFLKPFPKKFPLTILSAGVIFFSLYLFLHVLFLNPRYNPAGIYHPLYLLIPFIVFSCLEKETIEETFKYGVFVLLFLSIWGLLQHFTGLGLIVNHAGRANAVFFTPNSFATAINLFLLPLIVLYVSPVNPDYIGTKGINGNGTKKILICLLILFAALLASNSRGGFLAFAAGVLFFASFLRWRTLMQYNRRFLTVVAGLAAVTLIFKMLVVLGLSSWDTARIGDVFENANGFANGHTPDVSGRLKLYSIAWKIIKENMWWGAGYLNFGPLFEIYKIPPFLEKTTSFVHNDYLQFWLENGLLGLLSLLAVITSFYFSILKKRGEILKEQQPILIMAGAAVTSIFAHAVVDFPFYIPALLIVLGAFLGAANRELSDMGITQFRFPASLISKKIVLGLNRIGLRLEFLRGVAVSFAILWLALPMLSEISADIGLQKLKKLDVRGAVFWYAAARTLEPRNSVYYWQGGIVWRDQASLTLQNRDEARKAAKKADLLFSKGTNVNPYDTQNLMERIRLHRDYRKFLEQPAMFEEMVAWAEKLYARSPYSPSVWVEYARTLAFVGKKQEAMLFAKQMQNKSPESQAIKNLISDLEQGVF